jgi:hypothetical protein
MRKDSIDQKAIEAAYLIYSERGLKIVDYDFSHPSTDYQRGTVMEPESNGKLKQSFNEILPSKPSNERFNSLQRRDDEIEEAIENLQQEMKLSRQRGAFQQLQNQMRQMNALIKEKERINADMAVENLGAAQTEVYDDTMDQDDFSEMSDIGSKIADLEARLMEYREQLEG